MLFKMRGGRWTHEAAVEETNPLGIVHAYYDPADDKWHFDSTGEEHGTNEVEERGYAPDNDVARDLLERALGGPVDVDGGTWERPNRARARARYTPATDLWSIEGVEIGTGQMVSDGYQPRSSVARRVYLRAAGLWDREAGRPARVPSQDPIHQAALRGLSVRTEEG